jgi:hypothetical protein
MSSLIPKDWSLLSDKDWTLNYILPKPGRRRIVFNITTSGDISNGTVSIYCEPSDGKEYPYIVVLVVPINIEPNKLKSILDTLFRKYNVKTFPTPQTRSVEIDIAKKIISEYSKDGLHLFYGEFKVNVYSCSQCSKPNLKKEVCFFCSQSNSASGGGAIPKDSSKSASGGGAIPKGTTEHKVGGSSSNGKTNSNSSNSSNSNSNLSTTFPNCFKGKSPEIEYWDILIGCPENNVPEGSFLITKSSNPIQIKSDFCRMVNVLPSNFNIYCRVGNSAFWKKLITDADYYDKMNNKKNDINSESMTIYQIESGQEFSIRRGISANVNPLITLGAEASKYDNEIIARRIRELEKKSYTGIRNILKLRLLT